MSAGRVKGEALASLAPPEKTEVCAFRLERSGKSLFQAGFDDPTRINTGVTLIDMERIVDKPEFLGLRSIGSLPPL